MNTAIMRWIGRPENLFLTIGLILGILYLVITPPFQVADEDRHFYRAFQVAEGGWTSDTHEGEVGGWLPVSVVKSSSSTNYMKWDIAQKITRDEIITQFKEPLNPKDRVFTAFRSSAYTPVAYLPAAVVMRVGIWCKCTPIFLMYLGRTANLACWLLLIWISIRMIPFFKWGLFVLALTPMSLYQAASLSADCVTNALAFLAVAYFVYLGYGPVRKIGYKTLFMIIALTLLLSLTKNVLFLFCFLFLIIPFDKLSGKKQYFLFFTGILALNLLASLAWSRVVRNLPIFWNNDVYPDQQVHFILAHPVEYVRILISSAVHHRGYMSKGFIGAFGWSFFYLNKWHNRFWGLLIIAVSLTDADKRICFGKWPKLLLVSIFGAIALLVYTLLYVFWYPVGTDLIDQMQARYFIPIAPLFFLCLYNRRFSYHSSLKPIILGLGAILSLTIALFVIYSRFYVL